MGDWQVYDSLTSSKAGYSLSGRLQTELEKLGFKFNLEGMSFGHYFGKDPNKGSIPYLVLSATQKIFTNHAKDTYTYEGKYDLEAVGTALIGAEIKWSGIDKYLSEQNKITGGEAGETATSLTDDDIIAALLTGAGLDPALYTKEAQHSQKQAVHEQELLEGIPGMSVSNMELLLDGKDGFADATISVTPFAQSDLDTLLQKKDYKEAIKAWLDTHSDAPQGLREKIAALTKIEDGAEGLPDDAPGADPDSPQPIPISRPDLPTSGSIPAYSGDFENTYYVLTSSGYLKITNGEEDTETDSNLTDDTVTLKDFADGQFTVKGTAIDLNNGLSAEEARVLGFPDQAYAFFSQGGIVGLRTDKKGISERDMAAVRKGHIDKVIKGMGEGNLYAVVQRYVTAQSFVLIPAEDAARSTLNGKSGVKVSDFLDRRVASGNREAATAIIHTILGRPAAEDIAELELDYGQLTILYATLGYLAQRPADDKTRALYSLATDNLDDITLLHNPDLFLKWLKGDKVEKKDEVARGGETGGASGDGTLMEDIRDFYTKYFDTPTAGQTDSPPSLKAKADKAAAEKDLTALLEKHLKELSLTNRKTFDDLLTLAAIIDITLPERLLPTIETAANSNPVNITLQLLYLEQMSKKYQMLTRLDDPSLASQINELKSKILGKSFTLIETITPSGTTGTELTIAQQNKNQAIQHVFTILTALLTDESATGAEVSAITSRIKPLLANLSKEVQTNIFRMAYSLATNSQAKGNPPQEAAKKELALLELALGIVETSGGTITYTDQKIVGSGDEQTTEQVSKTVTKKDMEDLITAKKKATGTPVTPGETTTGARLTLTLEAARAEVDKILKDVTKDTEPKTWAKKMSALKAIRVAGKDAAALKEYIKTKASEHGQTYAAPAPTTTGGKILDLATAKKKADGILKDATKDNWPAKKKELQAIDVAEGDKAALKQHITSEASKKGLVYKI